jgi:hypothetical protein
MIKLDLRKNIGIAQINNKKTYQFSREIPLPDPWPGTMSQGYGSRVKTILP